MCNSLGLLMELTKRAVNSSFIKAATWGQLLTTIVRAAVISVVFANTFLYSPYMSIIAVIQTSDSQFVGRLHFKLWLWFLHVSKYVGCRSDLEQGTQCLPAPAVMTCFVKGKHTFLSQSFDQCRYNLRHWTDQNTLVFIQHVYMLLRLEP